jgi:hypothetical protein
MTDFPDVILADAFFGKSDAVCGRLSHLSQICVSFVLRLMQEWIYSLRNEAS